MIVVVIIIMLLGTFTIRNRIPKTPSSQQQRMIALSSQQQQGPFFQGDEFTFHDHDKCIEARRPRPSSLFEDYPFHKLIPQPTPPVPILWDDKEFSNKIIPNDFVPWFQDGGTRVTLGEYLRRFGQDAKKTEGET